MAFQNKPHLNPPGADDPLITVKRLLEIIENLQKHVSPKMENPLSRVARSHNDEANENNNSNGDLFLMLSVHLELIKDRLLKLQVLRGYVQDEITRHSIRLEKLLCEVKSKSSDKRRFTRGMRKDVYDITRKISDLVGKLSVMHDKPAGQKTFFSHDRSRHNNGSYLPGLHQNERHLTRLQAFIQVKQEFMELDTKRQICLLSFAVFPENRAVHRTMLKYWWIGEGILPVKGAEEAVRDVLKNFTDKNLVEPVEDRHKVAPSSYKMTPFVHSSVIHISTAIGLFDIYRKGEKPTMHTSYLRKVCLVEGSSDQKEAVRNTMMAWDIESVFNVSESYPEFTFKWFLEDPPDRMFRLVKTVYKSIRVFYLGRWERTQKRRIYVPNPELMKRLKLMKNLRFLSFQGISALTRLKSSVCKLHKLIVLDLRECYDLTKLPEKIDSLKSLVYLDMTGCHMLEWVPMRMALLHNLEVLKGFVVSDTIYEGVACNLNYLKKLKKLRKLSIEIHRDDLSVYQLMEELIKLRALTSLKVTWRRDLNTIRAKNSNDSTKIEISLPKQLKKLDLQRFPDEQLPAWLHPRNLLHLKKLHIGGARTLKGFGAIPKEATKCGVEVLRLTSLPKLRVGWIELKKLYFPKLTFIENHECPRVSLTPCDGNGIWRSDQDD